MSVTVLAEQHIDQCVELHHFGVLAEVVLGLAQECIVLSIAANCRHFPGSLERRHDLDLIQEA